MTTLDFNDDGTVTGLDSGELPLDVLGTVSRRRFSHIWPVSLPKQVAFRILRAVFSEQSAVAAFCRRWNGPWQVRLVGSVKVVRYTSQSRQDCILWEQSQLTFNPEIHTFNS